MRLAGTREVFVIERRRRVVTLDVHSERDAMAELALWERDPDGYRKKSELGDGRAARLDDASLAAFLAYCVKQDLSKGYRKDLKRYLTEWGERIGGRPFARMKLADMTAALRTWPTAEKPRIIALKAFTAWLRESGDLEPKDDPTTELRVPSPIAEKDIREKGYSIAEVEAVYRATRSQRMRDVVCVRVKTGMHHTELERLGRGDNGARLRLVNDPCGIVGTAVFIHKKKRKHIVSLDAQAFAAAQRLRRVGVPHSSSVDHYYRDLAKSLGWKFNPGELRHTFGTIATNHGTLVKPSERGVPLDHVAAVMGHESKKTTKRFYDGTEVPPMIAIPVALAHPEDPVAIETLRSVTVEG